MATQIQPYVPMCVVCGPSTRCDQPVVEGVVRKVERRVVQSSAGPARTVDIHLVTANGTCLLSLGERYAYVADGLTESPDGLTLRAYHLRRGRAADPVAGNRRAAPRYLTDADSVVVLEPDWLVDVTALTGTDYCLRQWLADRLAAQPASLPLLRGTAVHELFQTLCRDGVVQDADAIEIVGRAAYSLALLGATSADLLESVAPHVERLRRWRHTFGAVLFERLDTVPCYESTLLCPELGLRGRVDLALRRAVPGAPPLVACIVELKTGKYNEQWPDPEYQVRGYYAILASQRRLAPDFSAHVVYTGSEVVSYRRVECLPKHVDEIVNNRNRAVLALLFGHAPPAQSLNRCRKSGGRHECLRIGALLGLDHCRGRDLRDLAAEHADPSDAGFYAAQYRLLRLEARAGHRELAALWRLPVAERMASGAAIQDLEEIRREQDSTGRWRYDFRCSNRSELRPGDTVLVSDGDPVRGEIAVGQIVSSSAECVGLELREPVDRPRLIDLYPGNEAQDRTLRALHAWLAAPVDVRQLVYCTRAPTAGAPVPASLAGAGRLNRAQARALEAALSTRDYALIQGPPGTGKTHLIARLVLELVARGERVLIAAWTNQAVDTMLRALRAEGCESFARLGSTRGMDPALLPFALVPPPGAGSGAATPEAIRERLRHTPVLAGTVSAFSDTRIAGTTLCRDVVILDEAAQLSVPAAVGVLRLARRFVLVGDDQQLPPIVQSEDASREGLSISPFALLRPEAQAHGAFMQLSEQYRMHSAIAAWPSEAFYAGSLVAHASAAARQLAPAAGSASNAVTNRASPVVLIDAGPTGSAEAALAADAALALMRSGVPAAEVGVVAPFRATVAAIRRLLEEWPEAIGCTVDTVDRFQGGQREAMIVCLGLHGAGRRGHTFVDDPRRLNVAFTRARAKLVVIGDFTLAATLPTLAGFVQHCQDHGIAVAAPSGELGLAVADPRAEMVSG